MVIFEKDWERFPGAIWDTKTKNVSFLHYSGLLRAAGISNYLWPLQLHNPDLQGIDPHDPNLTDELKALIAMECKNNFFYFIREVVRIPGSDEIEVIPYKMNRAMGALYWLYFSHVIPYLVMIRQSGKSLGMDVLKVWLANIRLYFSDIALVTKNETLRSRNMQRIKDIDELLPDYLRMRSPKDPANSEIYKVSVMKNVLRAHLASAQVKVAEGLGRGLTDQHTEFDELAYLFNIEISLPVALAAGTASRDRARRRGDPYGVLLATTAGKKDDRDGRFAYGLMMDSAPWSEVFFDAPDESTLHRNIELQSRTKDIQVFCSFIHTQLGLSDEWLRKAVREAKATGEDAERDFGNVWTSGSLTSPLGSEISKVIRDSEVKEPFMTIDDRFGYALRWINHQDFSLSSFERTHAVISLDASDAIGRDDIGLVIEDAVTGGVLGAGDFNRVNLFDFARWLGDLMIKYPKTVLVPEMRSSARSMVDYLLARFLDLGIDPFTRIFNTIVQNAQEKPNDFETIRFNGTRADVVQRYRKFFGFATSATGEMSRNILYGRNLTSCAAHCGRFTHDTRLINQVLSLVIRNGRIDHTVSGNDDLVTSWLLGHWFLTNAKNIHHYGIPASIVLRDVDTGKEFKTPEDRYRSYINRRIREELEKLSQAMKNEPDEFLYKRLENRARMLIRTMRQEEMQTFSVSDFFEQIQLQRTDKGYLGS